MLNKTSYFLFILFLATLKSGFTQDIDNEELKVSFIKSSGNFPIVKNNESARIYDDPTLDKGIKKALSDFQKDVKLVSGKEIQSINQTRGKHLIIAGIIGQNSVIDKLIKANKIDVSAIKNTWENCLIKTVKNPFPGVQDALIIAGSDKRGAIYGIYSISEKMGVSPWYYWADVPTVKHKNIFIDADHFVLGSPKVKYRGIFLNDEAPALSGWATEKFGGLNHQFYSKVFELILRLKGNYLWPAMWGNAFNDDDKMNPVLADEYGIVMGTSHHEPMLRAQQEWKRFGKGAWNYQTNEALLKDFWKKGIENMGNHESIVTIGMRGDGDEPMSEGSNISLLERIVKDQREIITDVTNKPANQKPQLWALYKEVQDYYDKGMRVPDDVTLLLCDDNWGNIRKLPALNAVARSGGFGIYYHFDYVGGPRNYKWINTNPITKVWEQMHLAYEYNAKQIWLVNVGDLKPMEFPISFFLDYAWNPEKINQDELQNYTVSWAKKQFGEKYAKEIAEIISLYSKYNGRRKPELLNQYTFSLSQAQEFEKVVNDYERIEEKAKFIIKQLASEFQDAYYQLVLHPVSASANLYKLYLATAKNQLYFKQGRVATNEEAQKARAFYKKDSEITQYYNDTLANGKWSHMMDQTHIGYTYWQQPNENKIPDLKSYSPLPTPQMALSVSNTEAVYASSSKLEPILPEFNKYSKQEHSIALFNQGLGTLNYTIEPSASWIKLNSLKGEFQKQVNISVAIDWSKVPKGDQEASINVKGADGFQQKVTVKIKDFNNDIQGFIPHDGIIAIEAAHFNKRSNGTVKWQVLPDYGRTLSGVTPFPVTATEQIPGDPNCPVLEYKINIEKPGTVKLASYLSPSLDFQSSGGLRFAVSIDDEKPQIININQKGDQLWNKHVAENINIQYSTHQIDKTGAHTLKIWMVDPGVVLQKLVISPKDYQEKTYLGPTESIYVD